MKLAIIYLIFSITYINYVYPYDYSSDFNTNSERVRFYKLTKNLRCPKCPNQNIAESNAPISKDLRVLVLSMLHQGKKSQEIIDFLVERYGDFILYKPILRKNTIILWFGPLVVIIIGFIFTNLSFRRKRTVLTNQTLSECQIKKLGELVEQDNND